MDLFNRFNAYSKNFTSTIIMAKDHPHLRGYYSMTNNPRLGLPGSPPLSREGRQIISRVRILRRITPACAGRTSLKSPYNAQPQDHPRMCGKDAWQDGRKCLVLGSPPRVLEGQALIMPEQVYSRITPACAGRT